MTTVTVDLDTLKSLLRVEEEIRELLGDVSYKSFIHLDDKLHTLTPKEVASLRVLLKLLKIEAQRVRETGRSAP